MDLLAKRAILKKKVQPIVFAGLQAGLLLNEHRESIGIESGKGSSYFENPEKLTLGWVFGAGFLFKNMIGLQFEVSHDILPAINNERIKAKNLVWSLTMPVYISYLL